MGSQSKDVVDTRWVLTWKEAKGMKAVKARLGAKSYQGPDLRNGNVDIAGCVSRGSPHVQVCVRGGIGEMGDLESGFQERLSPSRWLRS